MAWFEQGAAQTFYQDSGSGTPVLVLPGFAGNIEEFAGLHDTLVGAGYRVIAADLPGSGRSQPQPRVYTPTYFEEDAKTLAALLETLQVGPTHLMGFSDGGEVAVLMAALTPQVARSVVAWGAAGALAGPGVEMLPMMLTVVDAPIPPMQGFRDYLVGYYGEANARAMTQSFAQAAQEIVKRGGDISLSKAGSIQCPVLLVVGEHDFLAAPPLVAELGARIRDAQVEIVEGAKHDVYSDKPEWLTETILEWLKGH